MSQTSRPFEKLGERLKNVREHHKRSLAEVSGAIEIDEQQLQQIESGKQRPDEDIMLLLISYFNVQDNEALKLWELADYDSDLNEHLEIGTVSSKDIMGGSAKSVVMLLAIDMRTIYSDGLSVDGNKSGLTLNFTQTSPVNSDDQKNTNPVARIGISHKQAEEVISTLQHALLKARYQSETKLLPPKANN